LSIVSPWLPVSQPKPPPNVSPALPAVQPSTSERAAKPAAFASTRTRWDGIEQLKAGLITRAAAPVAHPRRAVPSRAGTGSGTFGWGLKAGDGSAGRRTRSVTASDVQDGDAGFATSSQALKRRQPAWLTKQGGETLLSSAGAATTGPGDAGVGAQTRGVGRSQSIGRAASGCTGVAARGASGCRRRSAASRVARSSAATLRRGVPLVER
jgi:hypothetical protein